MLHNIAQDGYSPTPAIPVTRYGRQPKVVLDPQKKIKLRYARTAVIAVIIPYEGSFPFSAGLSCLR